MKKKYLAVYDYGSAGVWLFVSANTKRDIQRKYPELQLVEEKPDWMKGEQLKAIETNMTFDVDDPPTGWLLTLVEQRRINGGERT